MIWRSYYEGKLKALIFLKELFKACDRHKHRASWPYILAWIDGLIQDAELDIEEVKELEMTEEEREEELSYLYGRKDGFQEALNLAKRRARRGEDPSWSLVDDMLDVLIEATELDIEVLDSDIELEIEDYNEEVPKWIDELLPDD